MKSRESVNLYRFLSMAAMVLATVLMTVVLCAKSHLYADEWICLLFLDAIFLLIYVFELEYERLRGKLAKNSQTNFIRIAGIYVLCALLTYIMTYLPEFFRPVMLVSILMASVSNTVMSLSVGLFFDILMSLSAGGSFYSLACFGMMSLLGAVLSHPLREKTYRLQVAFLFFFINLMVPDLMYYLSYKEITTDLFLYGLVGGAVTAFTAYFGYGRLWEESIVEVENKLLDIVSEEYSEVIALKDFSMSEYRHAKKVSDIAYRCGGKLGYNTNLCLAGGFYYRMGCWIGEPHVEKGVEKAHALCFPEELVMILSEYYGEEKLPSSPESALIHMVDALIIKLEALEKDVGKSRWNHNMLIYQTLNEFSSSGLYDESGMSMNHFLKVRDFLAKEDILR